MRKLKYLFSHWGFSWSAGMKVRRYKRSDGRLVTISRVRKAQLVKEGRIVERQEELDA